MTAVQNRRAACSGAAMPDRSPMLGLGAFLASFGDAGDRVGGAVPWLLLGAATTAALGHPGTLDKLKLWLADDRLKRAMPAWVRVAAGGLTLAFLGLQLRPLLEVTGRAGAVLVAFAGNATLLVAKREARSDRRGLVGESFRYASTSNDRS